MADPEPKPTLSGHTLDYGETLMYGQYRKDLAAFAQESAAQGKKKPSLAEFPAYKPGRLAECKRKCLWVKDTIVGKIGEDWLFLTLLGVLMALLSFGMDYIISIFQKARIWSFEELSFSVAAQYFAWLGFPLIFICFSTVFVHLVGPNAIGSGIPEMKTILRGVVLKEYLTMRTLVAKVVGLVTSLGCGMPIGKEGPFVHVASIVATQLGKFITSFRGIYENESRNSEMLAAACAVGVACTFAAPIGGVLFSIEVTATYFAVRNYWRGFYSAVCGAFVFRLMAVWFQDEETLTALFKTSLRQEFPFDPLELVMFSVVGIMCGFGGALFVYVQRKLVEFIRKRKKFSSFMQKNRFLFPSLIVVIMTAFTFPPGFGQYMAGQLSNHEAVNQLFSNFTWSTSEPVNVVEEEILRVWEGPQNNVFITLVLFVAMRFWMIALATTLPVPAGVFMPVFTLGAAFGRLIGESVAVWFPDGINGQAIVPGGYAIVGAAALAGSVTHTVSTAVIVFELTGQMGHVLPCIIAVLMSNAVAYHLSPSFYDMVIQIAVLLSNAIAHTMQPSFYDSLIHIKRLPYLPDIIRPEAINAHRVFVEDFMVRKIYYLTSSSTYREALMLLEQHRFRAFPLVDSKEKQVLLGSITRAELQYCIATLLSRERRIHYFNSVAVSYSRPTQQAPSINDHAEGATAAAEPSEPKVSFAQRKQSGGSGRFAVSKVDSPKEHESNGQQPQPTKGILKNQREKEVSFQAPVHEYELTPEEELAWEKHQLDQKIDFDSIQIDPAPFQLVERTSLYKVHSMFSLLSLHHAYVVNLGRLEGIVSLKEIRNAIEGHLNSEAQSSQQNTEETTPGPEREDRDNNHQQVVELEEVTHSNA